MNVGDKVEYNFKYWEVKKIIGEYVQLDAYMQPTKMVHKNEIHELP